MSTFAHTFYEEAQVSEPTIIDTALTAAAQTVVSDLEPAAHTALTDLKAFVHGQADRLRTVLPELEQAAVDHVRSMATAVLDEYNGVLTRIEAHLGSAPTAPTVAPGETGTASSPAVPDQVPAAPAADAVTPTPEPGAPAASAPENVASAEPVTGMAPAAGEPATTDATGGTPAA